MCHNTDRGISWEQNSLLSFFLDLLHSALLPSLPPCPVYRHYNITASKNIRKLKYLPQQPCRRCTVPPTVWSKTAKASSFQRVQHHPSMSALSVVKNFIQDLRLVVKTSLQWTTTKQSTDCRISYLQTRDTTVN